MAQQARPNCIGQIALRRAQLMTESTVVVRMFSSNRFAMMLTPDHPPIRGARRRPTRHYSRPLECSALPCIKVADDEDRQKDEHFEEPEERQLVEHDRPGK